MAWSRTVGPTLAWAIIALLAWFIPASWAGRIVPCTGAATTVPRYDIFELTLTLPPGQQVSHPLTEVEVQMILRAPDGREFRVGGFYAGEGKWKIRFAPDMVGRWRYTYRLTDQRHRTRVHGDGWLICVQSAHPGFVRQNPRNKYFWVFDNGQPFWPIGLQDCIGPGPHGNPFDSWALEGGDREGPWFAAGTTAEQYLDTYAQAGFNLFRFSPDNCSYSHFDSLDEYKLLEMAWTDELLQDLVDRGFRVFFGFFGYANAFIHEPDDPQKMQQVKRYLKYCVDRWGAYVDFWELLNEQNADPRWTAMMAEYVKSIDPYHHPITDWEKGALPAIDFYSPHWYEREIAEASDAITADYAAEWKKYGKPVIVGEQGNDENNWDYTSARRMRFRLWSALFNEISLVFWNTSYALNGHYMNIYLGPEERQYVRALRNFTTYLDAGMRSIPVERSNSEFRAYALASDERAAVYLHNRFGRSLRGETITLDIPRAGYGHWLAPDTLRLLGTFPVSAGRQTIALPDFRTDMALLITPEPLSGGPPTPIIDANPRFGVAPQTVVLDGRRSVGAFGRPIVAYEWSLGDGHRATGPTLVHEYAAGNYLVTLTVTDDQGSRASASLVVRVAERITAHRPPIVSAQAEPTWGKAPLIVRFRGEVAALSGAITRAWWDFGDGATTEQLEVEHVYDRPGTYLATLSAATDHDSRGAAHVVVVVSPP